MPKPKPKVGGYQPNEFNEGRRAQFILALLETGSLRGASARAQIDVTTVYRHAEANPAFRAQIDEARNEFQQSLLLGILRAGVAGEVVERKGTKTTKPGDWRALAWILEHHPSYRDDFAGILKQKVEVGGTAELPPIEVSTTVDVEVGAATMERLAAVVQVLLRAGKLRLPDPGEVIIDGDATSSE